jgi:hypothetical protein
LFRITGSSPHAGVEGGRGFPPSFVAGVFVRLSVWAVAAWWLAGRHDRPELAGTIKLVLTRAWSLAVVLGSALALGGFLANRVVECVQGATEGPAYRNGNGSTPQRGLAGAVGAGVYGLVVLLALLVSADFFDWPLTRTSAAALWGLAQHLLVAGGALLIAALGARWSREITREAAGSPERSAGQYTALGIVAGTTVLAVSVLLASAGALFGVVALAILGALAWYGRTYLPDVVAGLQLRAHKVREVWIDGGPCQVAAVGLVTTELSRGGETGRLQNRLVLDACMHGAPASAGRF